MKVAVNLLWVLLSVLGAVALAHVVGVVNPHEKVNGPWFIVSAALVAGLLQIACEEWGSCSRASYSK
ncbi:MAG: hypothetical protein Q7U39_06390 [Nitrospira sp.]|nr:hypothetical protein [Nitrospira sp.]